MKQIKQNLVSGLSKGIQAMVGAIRSGKNAFAAFGGAMLSMLGNIAIQTGETLLMTGLGIEAVRNSIIGLVGGPAIAAGIALIAFGALLSSLSGSSQSSGGGGGGGGAAASSATSAVTEDINSVETRKPETNIAINVQGNILDRRQTGLELAEVIQETFGSNGINYTTA